ncbi:uncharacterized protein [Miscanthus floridulus]|uniref:uncharacterized protein isoform X2 n=1 Tax=Miscanthus floridulus TaxID=154761 RepID=UPI00345AFB71
MVAGRPHEQIRPGDTSTAHPRTGVLHLSPRVPRPQDEVASTMERYRCKPGIGCTNDIVLYLCKRGHVEGGMVFQLLEDLTEMSTIKDCKDIFGYIESQQDVLGKVIVILILFARTFWTWKTSYAKDLQPTSSQTIECGDN